MNQPPNVSITSCILEHDCGVSELWIRCVEERHFTVYEPIQLQRLSGTGRHELHTQAISDAFALKRWGMANHTVFTEGRTSVVDEISD